MGTLEAKSKAASEIIDIEKYSDKEDFEEYLKMRQLEIQSQDFAKVCLRGLEKNRGAVPKISHYYKNSKVQLSLFKSNKPRFFKKT